MSLFKLQSLWTLKLETGNSDLASASVTRILYAKPNGTTGYWNASISGTKLIYNVQNGDIDMDGHWKFQAYVEIGGLKGFGDIANKNFELPISLP